MACDGLMANPPAWTIALGEVVGSPGRTRTSDPAVNSRLLYQLSYRGSLHRSPKAAVTPPASAQGSISDAGGGKQGLPPRVIMASNGLEAGGGIEPPIEDLQSPALPLCYPAAVVGAAKSSASAPARAWHGHDTGLLQRASDAVNGTCSSAEPGGFGRMRIVAPHPRRYSPHNCKFPGRAPASAAAYECAANSCGAKECQGRRITPVHGSTWSRASCARTGSRIAP
jgi:hypothetical protein